MIITVDKIAEHKPCKDRFDNFKKEYPNYSGTLEDFLNLDRITYDDKVWVCVRLLRKNVLVHWSIKCAESVLPNFELVYPDDKRVRQCLETLKSISDFENMTNPDRGSARSAASAAWSAAWSAESAESARSAAWSAESAASANEQEHKNLKLLLESYEENK